ncbi:MAG: family 78 glycoside hydrolase catalytic domain [Tetrasphaera sp.]|nr:family 78 glycoside hydrolase catalytic domain [Tetrasphaera sp.]
MPTAPQGDPVRVRVEHLEHALGIGVRTPRLSWRLPPGSGRQLAYAIRIDDIDHGWRESPDTVLVPWPGAPLGSRERHTVAVRVRTDVGESPWSEVTEVEAGLLEDGDWRAQWIRPVESTDAPPGFRPAYLLRRSFRVTRPVRRARLYVTAHGIVETFLGERRVGDHELTPGYTDYDRRVQVSTFAVTDLISQGDNEIRALLADGWFRGSVGVTRAVDQWGPRTAYLAQLEMTHPDGTVTVVATGPEWEGGPSQVLAADLIEGQHEDHRRQPGPWSPVEVASGIGYAALVASPAPPVRRIAQVRPVAISSPAPGRQVIDLGQNINGWVRLTRLGPAGSTLTLTHGEALAEGDVTTEHLRPDMPFLAEPLRAGQVDIVVSAGAADEVFEPRLTTHGFRYVRIEGHPETLTPDDVTGIVVHTDLRETGSFACSDADLTRLHQAAVRSFLGNACDVPTDCPTRERAAWTGDWAVFAPVASFTHDIAGFSTKWLRDLARAQWDNGILDNMAPMPKAEKAGFLARLNGSAGWGDAIALVPWELWGEYGDRGILEEMWPHLVRWIAYAASSAREHRHPDRVARGGEPAAYEIYLWDSGFHWGEWLEPGGEPQDFPAFVAADKSDVATAYLAHTAGLAAQIAALLDRPADAKRYAALAAGARTAWRTEFVRTDGRVTPDTQATCVRALSFDLVEPQHRQIVADQLADLVRANGEHLATGFLATAHLLPVLAEHGHLDLAYAVLRQRQLPSWLGMLDRGATTMWERWDGIDDAGQPHGSLNHYSKGAVIGFLHGWVAGLRRVEPTWRRFLVAPRPGGGLTWARAHHDSPHGRIAVAWSLSGSTFHLDLEVPPGCTAEVLLPDGRRRTAGPGRHTFG